LSESLTSTGIEALDTFLKGGLPQGFCTLLLASPGSGSEIFAKQFAADHAGERVVFVSTDESEKEVLAAMREAGWAEDGVSVEDLQSEFAEAMMAAQAKDLTGNKSRFMIEDDAPRKRRFDPRELIEGAAKEDLRAGREKRLRKEAAQADYLGRLIEPFARLHPPHRMVVHSIDFFLNIYPVEQVVSSLTALKAANSRAGGQLLLVLHKGAHGTTVERRLELLADCLIELEVQRQGTKFERFLLVKKVRNRMTGVGVSTYDVGPDGFSLETLERIV